MGLDLLSQLFGVGDAQASEAPSGFIPPAGAPPMPAPRPQSLGQLPTVPTVQTPEAADPSTPSPLGNVLARLNARRSNVAGTDGTMDSGGGGAGVMAGAAAGAGHSKFGAFANGMMLGMQANSAAKKSQADGARQGQKDDLDQLKTLFGIQKDTDSAAETKRYHDILGSYYQGQNDRAAKGAGGSGSSTMTPAAIELARSRAAKRLGLMEPLPQYASDQQKQEHAQRRSEAQTRFDQWDAGQPWAGKGGAVAPPLPDETDDGAGTPPPVRTPAPAPAPATPAAAATGPGASVATPRGAAPTAPTATASWVKIRNPTSGEVKLYNPATKEMKPVEGE